MRQQLGGEQKLRRLPPPRLETGKHLKKERKTSEQKRQPKMLAKEMKMQFARLLVTWPMVSLPASSLFPPDTKHPHNGLPLVCKDIMLSQLRLPVCVVLTTWTRSPQSSLPQTRHLPSQLGLLMLGLSFVVTSPREAFSNTHPMFLYPSYADLERPSELLSVYYYFLTRSVSYLWGWMPYLFWSVLSNKAPSLKCWDWEMGQHREKGENRSLSPQLDWEHPGEQEAYAEKPCIPSQG